MPFHDWFLFGHKAHLVLEDEHGEFEVRSPLVLSPSQPAALDTHRIADAVSARAAVMPPRPERPVY